MILLIRNDEYMVKSNSTNVELQPSFVQTSINYIIYSNAKCLEGNSDK